MGDCPRCKRIRFVTSFTLVWIKMIIRVPLRAAIFVTSFTLVWIKMSSSQITSMFGFCHELHARVD